ncbi:acyltransferase family protein, partial [candidate division KSB1 bacterium]
MTNKENAAGRNRIYFLDNLRTFMIFLVVLIHAGGVYESSGTWAFFWIVDDYSTNVLADKLNLIIDIFVMAAIFFVSGFLTPLSLKNKSAGTFLKTKLKRLMIPWGIAVLTLMPLYKIIYLYSRNIPQESWTTYFHWNNGIFSQNWLWFLPVLFLFDTLYLIFSKVKIKLPDITIKSAIWAVFIIGFIYSYIMDVFQWQDWTKTALINFQNERLLIYFMIFLLGSLCYKQKIFESNPKSKKFYNIIVCTVWIPTAFYLYLFINTVMKPGNIVFSGTADKLLLWLSFHFSLLFLLYAMVNTFRYYLNRQGKVGKILSENSYNVYIIHVVVIGGIALTMLNTAIPSLLKYFILTVSTYIVSNLLVYFYRKVIKSKILIKNSLSAVPEKTILPG